MVGTRQRKRPDESGNPGYITPEGYRRLEEEAQYLWNVKRPETTKRVADAAAEGDRSENAEYIYGKRLLAEIDRRLRFLGRRLDVLKIVAEPPQDNGKVYFGCYVEVEDEEGKVAVYRIVGPDEWDAKKSEISMNSPMGRTLLGKEEGDEITLRRPMGDILLTITKVSVGKPSGSRKKS